MLWALLAGLLVGAVGASASCTVADCTAHVAELVQRFACGSDEGCAEEVQRQLGEVVPIDAEEVFSARRDTYDALLRSGE
jgi:hypothetical protein